jgi:hypothetical protein
MVPATWGRSDMPAKVAPPLKSTSTKASCSGGWVMARAVTRVRSSSLLPEPVAPTTSPCGPIPPSAASFRSSTSGLPTELTPTGTRRNWWGGRGRQPACGSSSAMSATPSSSGRPRSPVSTWSGLSSGDRRSGASRRARASPSDGPARSGRPAAGVASASAGSNRRRAAVTRARRSTLGGSSRWLPASTTTVTPRGAGPVVRARRLRTCSWVRPAGRSTTTSRCGPAAGADPAPPRRLRRRASSSGASRSASSSGPDATIRAGSGPSPALGWRAWGSHLAHSHSPAASAGWQSATRRSSGAWKLVAWHSSARARARAAPSSPVTLSTPTSASGTVIGCSATIP